MLSDNVRAQRNAWLIGDDFLKRNYQGYPALRSEGAARDYAAPYIFNNYNVSTFTSSDKKGSRNPMVKIVNGFIDAINKYQCMPRYLIFVIDWDFVKFIDFYEYGVSKMIGTMLEWLIENLNNEITWKKNNMKEKRPGAVTSLEPKIIFVKMIDRPGSSEILRAREKFNAVLEETLFKTKKMYIMDIECIEGKLDRKYFDVNTSLNHEGRLKYWSLFDELLHSFDLQAIKLKPTTCFKSK